MIIKLKSFNDARASVKRHMPEWADTYNCRYGIDRDAIGWGEYVEANRVCDTYFVDNYAVPVWLTEEYNNDDAWLDILLYGNVITDEMLYSRCDEAAANVSIRLIKYHDKLYYHKMMNGKIVNCRCVGKADG